MESHFRRAKAEIPAGDLKWSPEIKDLARKHTDEALETLAAIMRNPKASASARVSAANALLDRGYGKAPLHITGDSISYVARLPEPSKTAEEWLARIGPPSEPGEAS